MKRPHLLQFLLMLCVLCVLFCACSSYQVPQNPLFYEDATFSFCASGTVQNTPCAFRFTRCSDGTSEVCFLAPAACENMRFRIHSLPNETPPATALHGVTVCYDGMEIPLSNGTMPASVYAIAKCFSLRQAELTECRFAENKQDTQLSFSCDSGTATLIFASESGYPNHLSAQLYGVTLSLTITDFVLT